MLHKKIGIVGFGNQGKPWAQNLKDSGWDVTILLRKNSASFAHVTSFGLNADDLENLVQYPILALLLPDDAIPVFFSDYGRLLQKNQSIVFAHGFCLHFKTVTWPPFVDLILLAPKGIGSAVREEFQHGRGVPCVLSIHRDSSGHAEEIATALAEGLGAQRAGVYKATAQQEVEADLFSEQALLCGGIPALVLKTFEILVRRGINPEVAYLECVHELGFMAKLFQEKGFYQTMLGASPTAQFGGALGANALADETLQTKLEGLFDEIRENTFAEKLSQESRTKYAFTKRELQKLKEHPIESVGESVRKKIHPRSPS